MKTNDKNSAAEKLANLLTTIKDMALFQQGVGIMKDKTPQVSWGELQSREDEGILYVIEGSVGEDIRIMATMAIETLLLEKHWEVIYRVHIDCKRLVGSELTSSGYYLRQFSPRKDVIVIFTTEPESENEKKEREKKRQEDKDNKEPIPPTEKEFFHISFQENAIFFLLKSIVSAVPTDGTDKSWEKPELLLSTTETMIYHIQDEPVKQSAAK